MDHTQASEMSELVIHMSENINIQIQPNNFEYDIFTLVKAFYPEGQVNVLKDAEASEAGTANLNIKNEESFADRCDELLQVSFSDSKLEVSFAGKNKAADIDYSDRPETKNILKRTLYDLLSEHTGITLPWGTLTGIRPVRMPLNMMEQGHSRLEAENFLRETYYVSPEKIKLSCDVAQLEIETLKDIDYKQGYSLYVGIPFCPTICLYCSFTSFTADKWEGYMDQYLDTVEKELKALSGQFNREPDTIYIGGGTPTVLSPERMHRLLCCIEDNFDISRVREFTVEAGRPDTITEAKLRVLREHGITRISINPQTMNQKTLDLIGRRHSVEDISATYHLAKDLGFENINMDLIVGLPGENIEDVRNTLKQVIALNPENVTIHSLAVKRAARLNLFKDKYQEMGMINNSQIMGLTEELLGEAGYRPYYLYRQKNMAGNFENVGYSKPGFEGVYNILIMEEKQTIAACGAGSSTKKVFPDGERIERYINPKDIKTYLDKIDEIIDKKRQLLEEE